MLRCNKKQCRRWSLRCLMICAMVNNTPIGFIIEHAIWEKTPLRIIPPLLGLH